MAPAIAPRTIDECVAEVSKLLPRDAPAYVRVSTSVTWHRKPGSSEATECGYMIFVSNKFMASGKSLEEIYTLARKYLEQK